MMRPAFSSTRQAAAFAVLLLTLLSLPAIVPQSLLPSREQSYASLGWENGPYPYIRQQIFEEKGDIDIAFIGSSHILHCLDACRIQKALSQALGRPASVRVLGWGGSGFDAIYFISKDLLAYRKVRLLVIYDDYNPQNRNKASTVWFRFQEDAAALIGLPIKDEADFYLTSLIGTPRNLLCLLRPNLPADPGQANYWTTRYRSISLTTNLGSTTSELEFNQIDAKPPVPFTSYIPETGATPADACIYSPATKTNFVFGIKPLPALDSHFLHQLGALARAHGTRLIFLHIPVLDEAQTPTINERAFWPDYLGSSLIMLGIPPARMFAGLTPSQAEKLYFNPTHLNKNGQEYFTTLILSSLLTIYNHPNGS